MSLLLTIVVSVTSEVLLTKTIGRVLIRLSSWRSLSLLVVLSMSDFFVKLPCDFLIYKLDKSFFSKAEIEPLRDIMVLRNFLFVLPRTVRALICLVIRRRVLREILILLVFIKE